MMKSSKSEGDLPLRPQDREKVAKKRLSPIQKALNLSIIANKMKKDHWKVCLSLSLSFSLSPSPLSLCGKILTFLPL